MNPEIKKKERKVGGEKYKKNVKKKVKNSKTPFKYVNLLLCVKRIRKFRHCFK